MSIEEQKAPILAWIAEGEPTTGDGDPILPPCAAKLHSDNGVIVVLAEMLVGERKRADAMHAAMRAEATRLRESPWLGSGSQRVALIEIAERLERSAR